MNVETLWDYAQVGLWSACLTRMIFYLPAWWWQIFVITKTLKLDCFEWMFKAGFVNQWAMSHHWATEEFLPGHGLVLLILNTFCKMERLNVQKAQPLQSWNCVVNTWKLLTNTNIWGFYWILSSRMTKTFRENCDINIVQQTSCEPLFPVVQMQLKRTFSFLFYAHVCISIMV